MRHKAKKQPVTKAYGEDEIPIEILDAMNEDNERNYIEAKDREDAILHYTAGKFYGFTWEWKWVQNSLLRINEPKYIRPCCPNPPCDLRPLDYYDAAALGVVYTCDKCLQSYTINYGGANIISSIEEQIERKIGRS